MTRRKKSNKSGDGNTEIWKQIIITSGVIAVTIITAWQAIRLAQISQAREIPTAPIQQNAVTVSATLSEICPNRHETSNKTETIPVLVKPGEVMYLIGYGFWEDGQHEEYGGFFITIKGRYQATIFINNGVYCDPVPDNSEQANDTKRKLQDECGKNCPTEINIP